MLRRSMRTEIAHAWRRTSASTARCTMRCKGGHKPSLIAAACLSGLPLRPVGAVRTFHKRRFLALQASKDSSLQSCV
jgi:hypothetical protein